MEVNLIIRILGFKIPYKSKVQSFEFITIKSEIVNHWIRFKTCCLDSNVHGELTIRRRVLGLTVAMVKRYVDGDVVCCGVDSWLISKVMVLGEGKAFSDALFLVVDTDGWDLFDLVVFVVVVVVDGLTPFVPTATFCRWDVDLPDKVDVNCCWFFAVELCEIVVLFEPVTSCACSGITFDEIKESLVVNFVFTGDSELEDCFCDGGHNKSRRIVMKQETRATTMVRVSSSTYSTLYLVWSRSRSFMSLISHPPNDSRAGHHRLLTSEIDVILCYLAMKSSC